MSRRPSTIEVGDYQDEILRHRANPPANYHPANANEPRRALTWNGDLLAGSNNGEGRNDWQYRSNVAIHAAVSGTGYAYGIAVAACNGGLELGQDAELSDLVKAHDVDHSLLCRRPACRAMWRKSSAPAPAQTPPSDGDQMT